MNPNSLTSNDDDIVDQLLRNLDIHDAETDGETDSEPDIELDDSRILSEIMGTGTEELSMARQINSPLTKWSMWRLRSWLARVVQKIDQAYGRLE
jgi:hypothetical protein